MHKIATLTHAILMVAVPCAYAQHEKPAKNRLEFKEHGFAIQLPLGWKQTEMGGAAFLAASGPAESGQRLDLNIRVSGDLNTAVILKKGFVEQVRAGIKKALPSYKADGDGAIAVSGPAGIWLRGKVDALHIKQYIFAGPSKGFIATFTYSSSIGKPLLESIEEAVASIELSTRTGASTATVKGRRAFTDHGLSMDLPKGWRLSAAPGSAILFLRGPGTTSINVRATASLTAYIAPKALVAQVEPALKKSLGEDYRVLRARSVRIDKRKSTRIESRFKTGNTKMRNLQLFVPGRKHGFILTFTANAVDYQSQQGSINKAIRSLRIN